MRVLAKVFMAVVVVLMLFVAFGFLATYGAVQFIERHPITPATTIPATTPPSYYAACQAADTCSWEQ